MTESTRELRRWLDNGVSPYHTVALAAEALEANGFSALETGRPFCLNIGGKYYVKNGTFLAAFTVGSRPDRFLIAAGHTDWPCMRIKPNPERVSGGCCRLSVEPYGGAILNSWFDRPLSMAGIAMVRTDDPMHPQERLVRWDDPLMTIPNLAIHMNREVNKGVPTKPNIDMLPLCAAVEEHWSRDGFLTAKLAEHLQVEPRDVLSYELYVYCAEKAQCIGFDGDFLSSPRLDNITSCHAVIDALTKVHGEGIDIAVLYDNEEIGSNTRRGADSTLLSLLIEKIAAALGMGRSDMLDACLRGMFLSCDAAHAMHPNHTEYADTSCAPLLNRGVVLKRSPRYSSEAETCAVIRGLCEANEIPLQLYMNRPDLAGGSTVGSMASALLAMPAADVGVPMLAMHSARELMGAKDQEALCRLCKAFFAG